MTMVIRRLTEDEYPEAARFVALRNSTPAHNIAYFDTSESGILAQMQDFDPDPYSGVWAMTKGVNNDALRGLFAFEASSEHRKAWLYGRLIDDLEPDEWALAADALYREVLTALPGDVEMQELHVDRGNVHVAEFSERHGFGAAGEDSVYVLQRGDAPSLADGATPLSAAQHSALAVLHDRLFPGTYYSGAELVGQLDDSYSIFVVAVDGNLAGYVAVSRSSDEGEAYIDFIGVDERHRRHGLGAGLMHAAIAWAFADPLVQEVSLTVDTSNPAIGMYEKLGFARTQVTRSFRKERAKRTHGR